MKYYWLTYSQNIQEIGKYEQSEITKVKGNINKLGQIGKIDDSQIILPEPIVDPKAKLTTYLSSIPINPLRFLILKNCFIDFLKDFNIEEFQTWNIKVHYKNSILKFYSLFYLTYPSQAKYVDYKNSEFLIGRLGDWNNNSSRVPISVDNYNEYNNLIESLRARDDKSDIRCHKLVLNLTKVKVDMFRLTNMPYFGSGYYVSERLKTAIEEQRFTGMAFKEIEEVDKRIEVIY
jgi:hypothetical protein